MKNKRLKFFMTGTSGRVKKLFQHSAIYSLSTSVQRLQSLILMPIYTNPAFLPELSEYGNYGLIYTFIAFMNYFYLYGMDSAFLRYFFLDKSDRKTVYSSAFFVLVGSGLFTSLVIFLLAGPIAGSVLFDVKLAPLVSLAALILFFDTVGNFPFLLLRAQEKAVSFTGFRMLRFSLELILNIVFVAILKKGVPGILYANICASALNLLIMLPFTLKFIRPKIDFSLLKQMLVFGLPFLPNGIAYTAIEMMDRFLVTRYLGKEVMAFYHANYKFAAILLLLIVGFRNAWQPFFLKIAGEERAKVTYARILNYYLLGAGVLILFVTFFIRDFLTLRYFGKYYLLNPPYWAGIDFIPLIILSYYFYGAYIIFTPAFYITKKSRYMFLFTGAGALVNLALNLYFLPRVGIWAAVWATVAAYLTMAILIVFVAGKIYPTPVNYKKIAGGVALVGSGLIIYYILSPAIWMSAIVFAGLSVLLVKLLLEPGELKQIKRMINR